MEAKGEVKHILVVKFKAETTQKKIDQLINDFAKLATVIPLIKDFKWGKDVSTANLHQGYTHVFQVTFASMEDVQTYNTHAAHLSFAHKFVPTTDSIILMDYKPTALNISK